MTARLPHLAAPLVVSVILGLAGCSTAGPTHAYLARASDQPIIDHLPGAPDTEISTRLLAIDELYGIAYDPFTDHLFLRVFPGNFIRVIDRPANQIKRNFRVEALPSGPGDLAIRSIDRNLFFAHPSEPSVVETTLDGVFVRVITLEHLHGTPAGVAYDQKNNRLLILAPGAPACVTVHDLSGKSLRQVTLDHDVRRIALAYDSTAAEFYAPLLDQPTIGVFNADGRLQRTLPAPANTDAAHPFIDVGPRSLIRMF